MAEHAVSLQRLSAALGRTRQLQLHKVAVFHGAAFRGSKSGGALSHLFERLGDVFIAHFHSRHFKLQVLVIAQLKFRQHLENRLELQRLALVEIQCLHLRLRNRRQLLLSNRSFDVLRHQRLEHLAFDVVRESLSDQSNGRFPRPKARNTRHFGEILGYSLDSLSDFVGGNLQIELAAASSFGGGASSSHAGFCAVFHGIFSCAFGHTNAFQRLRNRRSVEPHWVAIGEHKRSGSRNHDPGFQLELGNKDRLAINHQYKRRSMRRQLCGPAQRSCAHAARKHERYTLEFS